MRRIKEALRRLRAVAVNTAGRQRRMRRGPVQEPPRLVTRIAMTVEPTRGCDEIKKITVVAGRGVLPFASGAFA
jgi:hypothetical protein